MLGPQSHFTHHPFEKARSVETLLMTLLFPAICACAESAYPFKNLLDHPSLCFCGIQTEVLFKVNSVQTIYSSSVLNRLSLLECTYGWAGKGKAGETLVGVYGRNPLLRGQRPVSKSDRGNKEKGQFWLSEGTDEIGDRLPKWWKRLNKDTEAKTRSPESCPIVTLV